jgi:hypothetical protein
MFSFIKSILETGNYNLEQMTERIENMYVMGKITAEDMAELLDLAAEKADDAKQIDITAVLANIEERLSVLESAGVRVWVSGMSVAKGQTVLYDILKEGQMRYLRYDGGRASTSLSPGKIEGWVVLASAGGEVTHTVQKDENGAIILVPVAQPEE